MAVLITDSSLEERLKAERQASGADRFDEIWEGVYVMPPLANDEHQEIQGRLSAIFQVVTGWESGALVRPGVNISDRIDNWKHNFRCPDVVVFLPDTSARNCGTHWFGGPDLAVEIISPGDRTREKLSFYAAVGVRELLIVDRDPWALELYHPQGSELVLTARATLEQPTELASRILPLSLRLAPASPRPLIEITHRETGDHWRA